jgi:hypothetical protein
VVCTLADRRWIRVLSINNFKTSTLAFIIPKFYYFAQNKSWILGRDHRRHPYKLSEHSNSNKNFEIHTFANINIPGKIRDVTELPPQKNLVLEIEASLRTLEVPIVFKLCTSFEHLQLQCSCFFGQYQYGAHNKKSWELEVVLR